MKKHLLLLVPTIAFMACREIPEQWKQPPADEPPVRCLGMFVPQFAEFSHQPLSSEFQFAVIEQNRLIWDSEINGQMGDQKSYIPIEPYLRYQILARSDRSQEVIQFAFTIDEPRSCGIIPKLQFELPERPEHVNEP